MASACWCASRRGKPDVGAAGQDKRKVANGPLRMLQMARTSRRLAVAVARAWCWSYLDDLTSSTPVFLAACHALCCTARLDASTPRRPPLLRSCPWPSAALPLDNTPTAGLPLAPLGSPSLSTPRPHCRFRPRPPLFAVAGQFSEPRRPRSLCLAQPRPSLPLSSSSSPVHPDGRRCPPKSCQARG